MRHNLKYLSKIMTSVPNLLNHTVNFVWIYMNVFYGQDMSLLVTLTFLLRSQQDIKCQMQTCVLNCSTITCVASYVRLLNILTGILINAKELFKCR